MNTLVVLIVLVAVPESIDSLLKAIEKLDDAGRFERWSKLDDLVQSDPTVKIRLRAIVARKVPMGEYQRFVAAAHLAGMGLPTYCGPIAAQGIVMGSYLGLLRGTPRAGRIHKVDCEPAIRYLKLDVPSVRSKRTAQDTLWDVLQRHLLDFRIKPDGTFYIIRLAI
jgi:hypothetical protein